jgi:hypothetical protein
MPGGGFEPPTRGFSVLIQYPTNSFSCISFNLLQAHLPANLIEFRKLAPHLMAGEMGGSLNSGQYAIERHFR